MVVNPITTALMPLGDAQVLMLHHRSAVSAADIATGIPTNRDARFGGKPRNLCVN
jgi:hypothetical protein